MSLETFQILTWSGTVSSLFLFLLFFTKLQLWRSNFRWLGIYSFGSVFFDLLSQYLFEHQINPNIGVNCWIIFEFFVASMLYIAHFPKKRMRAITITLTLVVTTLGILNYFFLEGPTTLNIYTRSVACLILVFYSVYFFFKLLDDLPTSRLTDLPMFWISSGFLLYFSGTFILNISITYLVNTLNSNLIFFFAFLLALNIIKNVLLGIGCWFKLKSIAVE